MGGLKLLFLILIFIFCLLSFQRIKSYFKSRSNLKKLKERTKSRERLIERINLGIPDVIKFWVKDHWLEIKSSLFYKKVVFFDDIGGIKSRIDPPKKYLKEINALQKTLKSDGFDITRNELLELLEIVIAEVELEELEDKFNENRFDSDEARIRFMFEYYGKNLTDHEFLTYLRLQHKEITQENLEKVKMKFMEITEKVGLEDIKKSYTRSNQIR